MRKTLILLCLSLPLHAVERPLTFDNQPLGSLESPRILRSYLPDPGIEAAVFSQHAKASEVSKYNPQVGRDVAGPKIPPISGLVAAVGVNFGPALSYVFDTTECRLLYAWQGGFVDMTPYWGDVEKGSRQSFDYVPRLVGTMFWQTSGKDPVELDGKSISDLGARTYIGYQLVNGVPVFEYQAGDTRFTLSVEPAASGLSCVIHLTTTSAASLGWRGVQSAPVKGKLSFTLRGSALATFHGYARAADITTASARAGGTLFNQYGCAACHSIDGSKSHGPSVGKLADTQIEIEGSSQPILADASYLRESIQSPNAKIVKGYPPNYMPPFALRDVEYDSLVLYIQSLKTPE